MSTLQNVALVFLLPPAVYPGEWRSFHPSVIVTPKIVHRAFPPVSPSR